MPESGRINQKRRTRAAIVDAAQRLLADGTTPTVADAAAAAGVGRTTAYRYFPTQESLLVELTVTSTVDAVEALVAQPVTADGVADRVVEVLQALNRVILEDEVRYRAALRLYQDQWLAARADGDEHPMVREGRRRRWLEQVLAPLVADGTLTRARRDQLVAGLSLVGGVEAVTVFRDVCRFDDATALAMTEWAARSLLAAAIEERT